MNTWSELLRPILEQKIEEAMDEADSQLNVSNDALFPWIGDNCYKIMADAAICVLSGIEDAQKFLKENELLAE